MASDNLHTIKNASGRGPQADARTQTGIRVDADAGARDWEDILARAVAEDDFTTIAYAWEICSPGESGEAAVRNLTGMGLKAMKMAEQAERERLRAALDARRYRQGLAEGTLNGENPTGELCAPGPGLNELPVRGPDDWKFTSATAQSR